MKLKELLLEKNANLYPRIWDTTLGKRGLWKYKHREILEKKLGRKLRSDEIIHHKDDDENNFSLNNLQVVSRAEHARIGKPAKKYDGCKIPNCKRKHHAKGFCHLHYMKYLQNK